jgi:hypothetical protein
MKILFIAFLTTLLCTSISLYGAEKKLNEAHYRDAWAKANGGKVEVRMPDDTRCDVVTKTHAIEVEWAYKWYEGLGQSLWYSFQTNKKAGIVMILRNEKDRKYLIRLRSLIAGKKLKIDVWVIEPK